MINYKLINYCEFDKYAEKSYSLIHNEPTEKNLGDITQVNEKGIADFNMMTWGFPCTDISVAGKQKGFIDEDGNKTRSGLYYDGLRILKEKKPALSIIENVKGLTQKKFNAEFNQILSDLDETGYNNYWQVLNAKDYGIPQNRERVFIISVRKDLDNGKFVFPQGFDNGIRLKDILETEVDERYYISQEKTDKLIEQLKGKKIESADNKLNVVGNVGNTGHHGLDVYSETGIAPTLKARDYKDPIRIMQVGMLDIKGNEQVRRVYDSEGLSPTLNSMQGGNRQPKILEENELIQLGNIYPSNGQNGNIYSTEGVSPTISSGTTNTKGNGGIGSNNAPKILEDFYANRDIREYEEYSPTLRADRQGLKVIAGQIQPVDRDYNKKGLLRKEQFEVRKDDLSNAVLTNDRKNMCLIEYRIRKLTSLECFRLMGFDDDDFYILQENNISNTQIYKMAGNSIVVLVLYHILQELYKAMPYLLEDIKLSSFFSGIGAFEKAIKMLQQEVNK